MYAKMITQRVWWQRASLFACSVVTEQFFVTTISQKRFDTNVCNLFTHDINSKDETFVVNQFVRFRT